MEIYKQPLKEVLIFIGIQLVLTLAFWFLFSSKSFIINSVFAIPFSSVAMSFIFKRHKWHVNWMKYLVSGAIMLLISLLLYAIEEKYLIGILGDILGAIISGIWGFFSGVFKLIAFVLILLIVLAVSALFFSLFFLSVIVGNVIFTTWVLPKFDEYIEGA
jgi:hypothetical protein